MDSYESLQKAMRSLETGLDGLDEVTVSMNKKKLTKKNILSELKKPLADKLLLVAQALRIGLDIVQIHKFYQHMHYNLYNLKAVQLHILCLHLRILVRQKQNLLVRQEHLLEYLSQYLHFQD